MTASLQALAAVYAIKKYSVLGPDKTLDYVEKNHAINHYWLALMFESRRRSKRNG